MGLGCGIPKNLLRITDLGVKKVPDPGSATLHLTQSPDQGSSYKQLGYSLEKEGRKITKHFTLKSFVTRLSKVLLLL